MLLYEMQVNHGGCCTENWKMFCKKKCSWRRILQLSFKKWEEVSVYYEDQSSAVLISVVWQWRSVGCQNTITQWGFLHSLLLCESVEVFSISLLADFKNWSIYGKPKAWQNEMMHDCHPINKWHRLCLTCCSYMREIRVSSVSTGEESVQLCKAYGKAGAQL